MAEPRMAPTAAPGALPIAAPMPPPMMAPGMGSHWAEAWVERAAAPMASAAAVILRVRVSMGVLPADGCPTLLRVSEQKGKPLHLVSDGPRGSGGPAEVQPQGEDDDHQGEAARGGECRPRNPRD